MFVIEAANVHLDVDSSHWRPFILYVCIYIQQLETILKRLHVLQEFLQFPETLRVWELLQCKTNDTGAHLLS